MQMLATRLYTTTHVHALEFMFHFQKVPRGAVICQQKGWCAIEAQVAQRTNTYVRQYVHCVIKHGCAKESWSLWIQIAFYIFLPFISC